MATPNNGFEGIIVYTIHKDGCMNGRYYATGNPKGEVYNEIARKRDGKPQNLVGDYVCNWIESGNTQVVGTLKIQPRNKQGVYEVTWQEKGKDIFIGTGFLLDHNMFAVHYTTK